MKGYHARTSAAGGRAAVTVRRRRRAEDHDLLASLRGDLELAMTSLPLSPLGGVSSTWGQPSFESAIDEHELIQ